MTNPKCPRMSPDEAFRSRMWHHMHNGLYGAVAMAKQMCRRITDSPSTTDKSKQLARQILPLLIELYESLKTRKPYDADAQH